uniref:Protein kinase domain-containing protein n=1 Tax=Panagrellus redivivus TaxID=6233 RepID=A0A7E4W3P1_PANRE
MLATASPAASVPVPGPPVNSPVNGRFGVTGTGAILDTNGNGTTDASSQPIDLWQGLGGCWPTFSFGTFWRRNHGTDSDCEEFEIPLEAIKVNFKDDYIGGGTQSSVFRGVHNNRNIALKKLNRKCEVDIKMLMNLEHPNIVQTYGVSTKDIYPCIVMEYCEQGGLYDVLQRRKMTKSLFCKWSREIADGMAYLHSRKIIHRDLKSPNILVDKEDCTKICDFGSLYAYDKTFMPSVVMSFVGTSQYMAPEMMKNEPCNEKVDVWSFGIVLWELLTGETPYKGTPSAAIVFGVGSGRLQLHVPKDAPATAKLLFTHCWSKKPRNRPSFTSILSHLSNLSAEIAEWSEDAWAMRREVYAKEIVKANTANCQNGNAFEDPKASAEQLVRKRMHELRHAQEIREMYERKNARVDKMMRKLLELMDEVNIKQRELDDRERMLNRSGRSAPPPNVSRTQKASYIRAGPKTISGAIDADHDYECRTTSVVAPDSEPEALSSHSDVSRRSGSSSDEEYYGAPRPRRVPSASSIQRHSAGSTVRSPKLTRASMPSSNSERDVCRSGSGMYQFQRNSEARISGISADSGVGTTSTLTLEETGNRLQNYADDGSPLYRNVEGRWSDGRIQARRKPKRQGSRDSPLRPVSTVLRSKEKRQTDTTRSPNADFSEWRGARSMSMIESVDVEVEVEVSEDLDGKLVLRESPVMKPSPSYTAAINNAAGPPANERVSALRNEYAVDSPRSGDETSSVMLESSSTMISSLERSLEYAVGLSDGLSDKESRIKAAYKTHRRTASNPMPPVVAETSTESDNEAVYC